MPDIASDQICGARIISCVGGKYTVVYDDGGREAAIENITAKGAFRHEKIKPLPGDIVDLHYDGSVYTVNRVYDRKNSLIRPALANLDILYIVISCRSPDPVPVLADKITVLCEKNSIRPVIVVTKSELDPDEAKRIKSVYDKCGYDCFSVSCAENAGLDGLRDYIAGNKGTVSAFCGASGVGKSTLLNDLFPELDLSCETGEISEKIRRGRNTTRTVRLYRIFPSTYLADTPGFSLLDFEKFTLCSKEELPYMFAEFAPYLCKCKYTKCSHTKEDGCLIIDAVKKGMIPRQRFDSYLCLYDAVKNIKDWNMK
ncbi:MAG: ribosome small subunit-dependent GTPase A [Clostridia bacterium]|nr:ribosome small subunit-dependent GTPase A [Clostridia bacterium]